MHLNVCIADLRLLGVSFRLTIQLVTGDELAPMVCYEEEIHSLDILGLVL